MKICFYFIQCQRRSQFAEEIPTARMIAPASRKCVLTLALWVTRVAETPFVRDKIIVQFATVLRLGLEILLSNATNVSYTYRVMVICSQPISMHCAVRSRLLYHPLISIN